MCTEKEKKCIQLKKKGKSLGINKLKLCSAIGYFHKNNILLVFVKIVREKKEINSFGSRDCLNITSLFITKDFFGTHLLSSLLFIDICVF